MKILTKDILLSIYKLDFAHTSVYSADSANVKKKEKKKKEKGLPVKSPAHFVHNTTSVVCSLLPCEIGSLFSFSLTGRSTYKDF